MKTILRIARFELTTMFFSPIAWLVLIIFIIQTGLAYSDTFTMIERFLKMNFNINNGMTYEVFSHPMYGMFTDVLKNIYLYIPLLTMGLISKEISSGSIKLLMSSPLNANQLVLGKYFAMIGYCLIMAFTLVIFMFAGGLSIESADFGLVMSGILAFFLLTAAYSAIGLFISSLTSYQVVAAIGTLATLAGLNYVNQIGQGVPIISDLTYWLSLSGRTSYMTNGLISSMDVVYFLIIVTMFLAFAVIKISSGRIVGHWWAKARNYVLLFGAAIGLAYVSSRPALIMYFDTSATKFNTLTDASKDVVNKMDGPIKVTNYVNILDMSSMRATPNSQKRDLKRFDNYLRYLPQLEMEYVYFWDTLTIGDYFFQNNPGLDLEAVARKSAENWDYDFNTLLRPEQVKERIDLSSEDNQFVREIRYNGKSSFLRMYDDMRAYPSESETSAALKRLVADVPKVVFASGHGERDFEKSGDKDYQQSMTARTYRESMIQKGFDFERVNLASQSIPSDAAFLVLADPNSTYTEEELQKVIDFIDQGGNLLLLADVNSADFVEPITSYLGISFIDGQLIQSNDGFEPNFIMADFAEEAKDFSASTEEYIHKSKKVTMPGAVALDASGVKGFASKTLLEVRADNTSLQDEEGNQKGITAPVALALNRNHGKRQQYIMVVGDADFLNNVEHTRNMGQKNVNAPIVGQIFGWFTEGEFPVNAQREEVKDVKVHVTKTGKLVAKIILVGIIPGLLLAYGMIVLIRRRKK